MTQFNTKYKQVEKYHIKLTNLNWFLAPRTWVKDKLFITIQCIWPGSNFWQGKENKLKRNQKVFFVESNGMVRMCVSKGKMLQLQGAL